MKHKKYLLISFLFIFLLLLFGGCSRTVEQAAGSGGADSIAMNAVFEREDGTPLSGSTVRFSNRENSADYPLDRDGLLTISGLPLEGELAVTVLDGREESQGTVTLSFSQGAVIDAVTDENSMGYVTLKEDTREIALRFTLESSGILRCQLQLSESRIV